MKLTTKIALFIGSIIMLVFFVIQSLMVFNYAQDSQLLIKTGYILFLLFVPFSSVVIYDLIMKGKNAIKQLDYQKKLKNIIVSQSQNQSFYEGKVREGAMALTKEVSFGISCDRCSIWLYNSNKTSIICQQLYIKKDDNWYTGFELSRIDYESYFNHLQVDPVIVANDAENHPATSCFKDSYLIPLGIKSMLDVPIMFDGKIIGVICIENLTKRNWNVAEINFAQMLSTLYSFAHSIKEGNKQKKQLLEIEKFIDEAALISKTDAKGKITYVNKKFIDVSGFSLEETIGNDHNIVNSGYHDKEFWKEMYRVTSKEKKIWHSVVTNKSKDGHFYYVDSYIKADFDQETGQLIGFISIRQDVTRIIETLNELDKKNSYLEHSAKILRHDMHSGINTYIPRGISSLERRLTTEDIEKLKLEAPLKMIKEGLKHTQKVYKGVYEFTNLVKKDANLSKTICNIKEILEDYLSSTAYKSQVVLNENLPTIEVNEALFCTAIDNLIRNGLKYNDSSTKFVKVYSETERKQFGLRKSYICVEDNGRGIDQKDFEHLSKPYVRKEGQQESGSGLGLNICKSILEEHGFEITAEKLIPNGTKLKIKIK
jgi:PAS domain S-box-containing protein